MPRDAFADFEAARIAADWARSLNRVPADAN